MTDMREALEPCPFCGCEYHEIGSMRDRDEHRYYTVTIECGSCSASVTAEIPWSTYRSLGEAGAAARLEAEAIAAWNTRASTQTDEALSIAAINSDTPPG